MALHDVIPERGAGGRRKRLFVDEHRLSACPCGKPTCWSATTLPQLAEMPKLDIRMQQQITQVARNARKLGNGVTHAPVSWNR